MRPARLAVAGALCASLALASCGGASQRATAPAAVPSIRTADCTDWKGATGKQRDALLTSLYAFYVQTIGGSGNTPAGPGPTITAKQAATVFDNYCSQPYASAFKLYKLYGRAAAFAPSS